jgi:hypothetical protein
MFDLPTMGILALTPAAPALVTRLALPGDPSGVAAALLARRERRFDLLRTDSGGVTLGGAMLGGLSDDRQPAAWQGRVEVDDVVLTDGVEPVLACAIGNVGSSDVDGLPLLADADPTDGRVEVAVAVPVMKRRLLREATIHYEVRRASGRAASILPHGTDVRYVDDGVIGTLGRKRSWWTEAGAWGAYVM